MELMMCSYKRKCSSATFACLQNELLCTDLCPCVNCTNVEEIDLMLQ